jgi:predicted HTH transcriptional regulator
LLLAGHPSYLIGQQESEWLEVKSREYETGNAGDIELAQDVARFANGDSPGLLVLGFRENVREGVKVIEKMTPLRVNPGIGAKYHQMLDRRFYPPICGLNIEEVEINGGRILVIVIPEQDDNLKPFLVTGAIIDGKCEGAFISIVRRRGEHSIPVSPAAIHAALAAGRAAIRQANPSAGE